jgi:two-component system cell cycle sensor histidine kinase/response regulator CckA
MSKLPPEPRSIPPEVEKRLLTGAWKESLSCVTLGFAHDLNNVLTGILGLTEVLLLDARLGEPAHENLAQIKRCTQQAAKLIERLAALHQAKLERRDFHDLNVLVTQSLEFLRKAVPKRIEFATELSTTALPVFVDAVDFQHAFSSLIFNATDATPRQAQVIVRTSREDGIPQLKNYAGVSPRLPAACLTMQDDGVGLPAELMRALFEPVARSDSKPLGLGLFQVRRFVERHGGAVELEASGTTGTKARIFLPMADFTEAEEMSPA